MSEPGVENIVSHIQTKAEKEISEILRTAQTEAEKIRQAAQEKAEQEVERTLSNGKRLSSLEGQRMLAETKIDVRRKRMNVREEVIDSSFSEARKVLEVLAAKGKQDNFAYKDILFNLIASASEVVAGDRLELVLNHRDRNTFDKITLEEVGKLVKQRTGRSISLVLADEPMQFLGGVIVRDLDKSVEIDNTLETKLNRLKEGIRVDVAKILFGDRL
jgi:V/A-type H+-transporting ATPase subunit E